MRLLLYCFIFAACALTAFSADPCGPVTECDGCVRTQVSGDLYCQWCLSNSACFNGLTGGAQEQCPSQAEVVTLAYSSKCHSFMGLPLAGGVILLVFIILCPLLVGGVVLYCILKRRRGVQAKADTPYRPMTDHRTPRPRPGYAARPSPAPSHRDRLQEPLVGGGPEGVRLEEDSEAEGGQGGSQYHPPIGALATKASQLPLFPSQRPPSEEMQVIGLDEPARGGGYYLPPEVAQEDQ